ncbi:MAG: GTPase Era [Caldilineaceae bacterium]|nr:GTPase Era [Caldilineaceae bacterium]
MLPTTEELPDDHRSGFIAVIGRPNVGKSTLLNRLLGQKIAITSPKPQTTREQLLGVLTAPAYQMIFLDTPGIHKPANKLGEYMMGVVRETLADVDLILWLVDANVPPKPEDRAIAALLEEQHARTPLPPVVIALNKVDQVKGDRAQLLTRGTEYLALFDWLDAEHTRTLAVVPVSALTGENMDGLLDALRRRLPVGPQFYPEDQVTDLQVRFIAAELIREKALMYLQQEVPHSLAVVVDEFKERSEDMTYISAVLYVERTSQKGIVLGKNGAMIKKIGQAARPEIEALVGTQVYLELWVKVWEKWRTRENMLRRLGYATQ